MNNLPRQKLRELIAQYGQDIYHDPKRVEALLRDVCGEHKLEINALVSALKERVPHDLLAATGVPKEILVARLIQRLQDNWGQTENVARWTVESWAVALGVNLGRRSISPRTLHPTPTIPTTTAGTSTPASGAPRRSTLDMEVMILRIFKVVLITMAALVGTVGLGIGALYLFGYLETRDNLKNNTVKIVKGTSFQSFCNNLEKEKIIKSANIFDYSQRFLQRTPNLKHGEFQIASGISVFGLADYIETLKPISKKVTIPEGALTDQVVLILAKAGLSFDVGEFRNLFHDKKFIQELRLNAFGAPDLQGFLYPETYSIATDFDTKQIIETLIKQFIKSWEENECERFYSTLRNVYLTKNKYLSEITKYDIIVLASIVDELVDLDRIGTMPAVARIYYNRIAGRSRLYLKSKDVEANRFTALAFGLPPKPINNPGMQAIKAALRPAMHAYVNLKDIGIY